MRYSSFSPLHSKLGRDIDEPTWSIYLTLTGTSPTRLCSLPLRHTIQPRKLSSCPKLLQGGRSRPTSRRSADMSDARHITHQSCYIPIVPLLSTRSGVPRLDQSPFSRTTDFQHRLSTQSLRVALVFLALADDLLRKLPSSPRMLPLVSWLLSHGSWRTAES